MGGVENPDDLAVLEHRRRTAPGAEERFGRHRVDRVAGRQRRSEVVGGIFDQLRTGAALGVVGSYQADVAPAVDNGKDAPGRRLQERRHDREREADLEGGGVVHHHVADL
jgi:transposase